jgi:hypothetical protein
LLTELREQIAEPPSYSFRRACLCLGQRQRGLRGAARVDPSKPTE